MKTKDLRAGDTIINKDNKVVGCIVLCDYYKNNKPILCFMTESYIYPINEIDWGKYKKL